MRVTPIVNLLDLRVNPLLAKKSPHEEHEGHKRLLVSTAFHKRSMGYRREIVFLARWLAESLAFILLLRYSGLRIGDAVQCTVEDLQDTKLYLYTQKTGEPVCCPLRAELVRLLRSVPRLGDRHFFWTGRSKLHTGIGIWQRSLKRLFALAGIENGHAHRFRDTFAVELFLKGFSIEKVAVLLGHSDIKVTQRHYNPWVGARQEQLEAAVKRANAFDPILESIGTQAVRREERQKTNLFIIG
jgi:integrase